MRAGSEKYKSISPSGQILYMPDFPPNMLHRKLCLLAIFSMLKDGGKILDIPLHFQLYKAGG
jgi:hypothetical protein